MNSHFSQNLSAEALKLLGEAVDCSDSPVALYDPDFNLIYANQATRLIWPAMISSLENGEGIDQAVYNTVKSIRTDLSEAHVKLAADEVLVYLKQHEPFTSMGEGRRWMEMTHHKIGSKAIAGLGIEITALKENENKLIQAQETQKRTLAALNQGLIIVNKKGVITQFNKAYEDFTPNIKRPVSAGMKFYDRVKDVYEFEGIDIGEKTFDDWYQQDFWPQFNDPDIAFELEYALDSGLHLLWRQHYVKSVGNIITLTDVTGYKQQQDDLERAKATQLSILESLNQGVLIVDKNRTITQFNLAYQTYCQSRGSDVYVGQSFYDHTKDLVDFKDVKADFKDFDEWFSYYFNMNFNKLDHVFESEYSISDGRHFLWRQKYTDLLGNIISITDITDIKNTQLRAQEAELAKSEFLANMSHEIRTPMNGVMGMAQLLKKCDLNDKGQMFVDTIERSGQALLSLINDILDYSKIEAGHITLNLEPFSLRETIDDVVALLSGTASEKNVDLLFKLQENLPYNLIGDKDRLRQILINLVGNAVKFTHEGLVMVKASGELDGNTLNLKLAIEDSGIGIPADQVAHVFDKFRQVDGTKSRKYEGTGLGLSISSQLTELMGGEISVESELGKGTTFTLSLALPIATDVKIETEYREIIEGDNLKGANILGLEPNLEKQKLQKQGYSIQGARSFFVDTPQKIITVLETAKNKNLTFDLIVISGKLPLEDIQWTVQKVKTHPTLHDIPICLITSINDETKISDLYALGLNEILKRPVRYEHLVQALSNLIGVARNMTSSDVSVLSAPLSPPKPLPESAPLPHSTPSAQPESRESVSREVKNAPVEALDILVAEDNEVNKIYVDYLLKATGLRYKLVADGTEAVEAFKTDRPKLILMDVSMPGMNGYEATAAIRRFENETNMVATPIIALTAHAMSGDREKCLSAGMNDYLSKPVSGSGLNEILSAQGLISDETGVSKSVNGNAA